MGYLGRVCHQPNQINELHKTVHEMKLGLRSHSRYIRYPPECPAMTPHEIVNLVDYGQGWPMDIILLKLYFIVKTQYRCRKCWLIGHIVNFEYFMGFKPNFSLRILLATTVWQLVPPRIRTKVKYYHHETLLYPDARKKMVNSIIHACT